MKKNDWLLIGALGIGGYLIYKYLKGGALPDWGSGGGGGGTIVPTIPVPPGGFQPVPMRPIAPRESWSGVSFGQPGQPSEQFRKNTLNEAATVKGIGKATPVITVTGMKKTITISKPLALSKGSPLVSIVPTSATMQRTITAAAAIKAGAPPRVVAKIKGGSWG